jgi:outer membrane receptor protein involved in Fe transport
MRYSTQDRSFDGCLKDDGAGPVGTPAADAFGFLATILSGTATTIPAGGCVTMDATTLKPGLTHSTLDEHNLSWRVGANLKLSTHAMLYANVTRGYKSGSYSLVPGILSSQFTPVTQESVLAYEAGARISTPGNALSLDLAVFYSDYRDKQLKGIVLTPVFGPLPQLVNIPKSKVYGLEANLVARPASGLRLTAGATYVATKVLADPAAPAEPRTPFGALTTYVGEPFPNTPKWQLLGDVDYRIALNGRLRGFIGGSVTYRSSSPAAFGESPVFELPPTTLVDLRAGVETSDGRWSGEIWGRNITNEYYWTNVTHLTDYVSRLAGMPATYGVSFRFRY